MKFRTKLLICLVFLFFLNLLFLHYHTSSAENEDIDASVKKKPHEEENTDISKPTKLITKNNKEPEPSVEIVDDNFDEEPLILKEWDWSDEYLRRDSKLKRRFRVVKYNPERVKSCPEMVTRDLEKNPMIVSGRSRPNMKCTINYDVGGGNVDISNGAKPLCGYSYRWSMENVHVDGVDLPGNTDLTSEVPVPYFSWRDFGFYDDGFPKAKTEKHLASAFISNCGPAKRLNILDQLQTHGVTIDSYGRCHHNKDEPDEVRRKYNNVFQDVKMDITSRYKFLYSPENGETKDYITEKFFLPFCIGTVPIYLGAPNARDYAPSPDSYVDVSDFKGDIKSLAEFIIKLGNDEKEYQKYLRWKTEGPSRHFLSVMDLNNIHSSCRFALRGADLMRIEFNNTIGHEPLDWEKAKNKRYFKVRERNTFYLKYIYLREGFSMWDLEREIKRKLGWENLYKIYYLWDRVQVPIGNEEIKNLKNGDELEVIFLDSQVGLRDKFDKWMKNNNIQLSSLK